MKHLRLIIAATLPLLVLLLSSSTHSHAEEIDSGCSRCNEKGWIVSKLPKEYLNFPYLSSVIVEHKSGCCGLGWIPCPNEDCPKRAEALRKFNDETASRKKWLEGRREQIDKVVLKGGLKAKNPIIHASSDLFHLSGTFKKRKAAILDEEKDKWKMKNCTPEESLHLYCKRCEYAYRMCMKAFEVEKPTKPLLVDKFTVAIWEDDDQSTKATYALAGLSESKGVTVEATMHIVGDNTSDEYLHHNVVFAVANMYTGDFHSVVEYFPFWLKEAICHWIEYRIFDNLMIFTSEEGVYASACPTKDLRRVILKGVKQENNRLIPFEELISHRCSDSSGWERLKAMSIVDWMINGPHQGSLPKLVKSLKEKYPTAKQQGPSFEEVFGMNATEVDEAWKKWVLENYPKIENKF